MINANKLLIAIFTNVAFVLPTVFAGIDITYEFENENDFTVQQREHVVSGFNAAETLWENVITGRGGENTPFEFSVVILADDEGLASATSSGLSVVNGRAMPNSGKLWINTSQIENIVVGFGLSETETNFMDELLAHEIGHALGFGNLWTDPNTYRQGTGEYTGQFGLAAFREEFDADAEFIPVELAGGGGSANAHWNQLFRSSPQEGNPDNPLELSPLIGILDHRGRDLAQDLMSPAIDPDYGEPFLSNTTVQSLRDIGYDVIASFPRLGDMNENGVVDADDVDFLRSMTLANSTDPFFDLNQNGQLDFADREAWMDAVGTLPGDSNFDFAFDSSDLTFVFVAGEYDDDIAMNSTWAEGDWNGDGDFDTSDLTFAFQYGGYEIANANMAGNVVSVPEPVCGSAIWLLMLFVAFHSKRNQLAGPNDK